MPTRVSIIIPTLNVEASLPQMLDTLLPGVAAGVLREVIVSDAGSHDDTARLADEAGAQIIVGELGRGGQLRRGAEQASSDWLLFLHADTHLPPDWVGAVVSHIDARPNRAAVFKLGFRDDAVMARVTAKWANIRTRVFGLPYGDQGLLISRQLYDEVGGYANIELMEDVAIARLLGGRITILACTVTTDASRYRKSGWIRRGARNLLTLMHYLTGSDPEKLAKRYHKS